MHQRTKGLKQFQFSFLGSGKVQVHIHPAMTAQPRMPCWLTKSHRGAKLELCADSLAATPGELSRGCHLRRCQRASSRAGVFVSFRTCLHRCVSVHWPKHELGEHTVNPYVDGSVQNLDGLNSFCSHWLHVPELKFQALFWIERYMRTLMAFN